MARAGGLRQGSRREGPVLGRVAAEIRSFTGGLAPLHSTGSAEREIPCDRCCKHGRMLQPRLPDALGDRFSVADALGVGVSPNRLRKADLTRPFHGVRARVNLRSDVALDRLGSPLGAAERDHLRRAREYAARMPDDHFFTHVTAAVIWGLPLPRTLIQNAPIHVGVFAPQRLPRGKGVRGHQTTNRLTTIRREPHTGLLVASPASTWAMLGSVLRDPYDLIAAGDAAARDWRVARPLATIDELTDAVRSGRRVGVGALRAALPQLRTRAASRPESWTRLTLLDAGLAEPELNFEVVEAGLRRACVDLAYPELKIAIEYEGEHHLRDPEQWARDIIRYEQLAAAGWLVIRLTKAEVFRTPRTLVARVRKAIAARS